MFQTTLVLLILTFIPYEGSSLSCLSCNSEDNPECGRQDSALASVVRSIECDTFYTISSNLCFKLVHFANDKLQTVRGCAPFIADNLNQQFQKSLAFYSGAYWKSGNVLSFCSANNCNFASISQISGILFTLALLFNFLA